MARCPCSRAFGTALGRCCRLQKARSGAPLACRAVGRRRRAGRARWSAAIVLSMEVGIDCPHVIGANSLAIRFGPSVAAVTIRFPAFVPQSLSADHAARSNRYRCHPPPHQQGPTCGDSLASPACVLSRLARRWACLRSERRATLNRFGSASLYSLGFLTLGHAMQFVHSTINNPKRPRQRRKARARRSKKGHRSG